MRLLVADDDPKFCALIAQSTPQWLEPMICGSSEQAVALLKRREAPRPDLALVDLHMDSYLGEHAELEGLSLASWIRQQQFDMPVILVSASDVAGSLHDAPALGLLRKPIDLNRLYEFLRAFSRLFETQHDSERR